MAVGAFVEGVGGVRRHRKLGVLDRNRDFACASCMSSKWITLAINVPSQPYILQAMVKQSKAGTTRD